MTLTTTPDTAAAPLPQLQVNYTLTPKLRINLAELALVQRLFWKAYRPGDHVPTVLASIVVGGEIIGLDLVDERKALEPRLIRQTQQPLSRLA